MAQEPQEILHIKHKLPSHHSFIFYKKLEWICDPPPFFDINITCVGIITKFCLESAIGMGHVPSVQVTIFVLVRKYNRVMFCC